MKRKMKKKLLKETSNTKSEYNFCFEKYNFQIKRLNLTKLGYDYLIKYVDFEKLKELEKDIKY